MRSQTRIAAASSFAATGPGCAHTGPARISWARMHERVFEIDLERCPICGGDLKIRAVIIESQVGSRDCA